MFYLLSVQRVTVGQVWEVINSVSSSRPASTDTNEETNEFH